MPITKATDWTGDKAIGAFMADYAVYPELTGKLDAGGLSFDDDIINEIVLWKLGRYVKIPPVTLDALNELKHLKQGDHRDASPVLEQLLACNGVRLPMASTILRFANPEVFQIYDRHICRALTGKFSAIAPKTPSKTLNLYWTFLDELIEVSRRLNIAFKDSDRILFEFDKQVNPPLTGSES